jgi:ABC-type amino acid transport substrate-binding protein
MAMGLRTESIHIGPEWDRLMMHVEEHADPTEGMFLSGFDLDYIEELNRRVGQLFDIAMLYGAEREAQLVKKIEAKQVEWDAALKEMMSLAGLGG